MASTATNGGRAATRGREGAARRRAQQLQGTRAAREAEIRAACEAGDLERALTVLLQTYAGELLSFLVARLRDRDQAEEAFSLLAEDLWRGLPGFQHRSSARTWAYTLARHVAARYARGPARRRRRDRTLREHTQLSQLVARLRTRTAPHLRTDVKHAMRALREKLDPDDQVLLILRVDRQLPWRELAQVMGAQDDPDDPALDDAALAREAARLRKRFERAKGELKRLAREAGLLPD